MLQIFPFRLLLSRKGMENTKHKNGYGKDFALIYGYFSKTDQDSDKVTIHHWQNLKLGLSIANTGNDLECVFHKFLHQLAGH